MGAPGVTELFHPLCAPFRLEGNNGEAVLTIHGFTGCPAHFRLLAPLLHERGYTVSAPLLAGHGTSLDDMAGTGRWDWLGSAQRALAELGGHRRIHLVGMSMGGLLGILLAAKRPLASLTIINSPVRFRARQIYLTPIAHRLRPRVTWPAQLPPPTDEAGRYLLTYPGFPTRCAAELLRLSRMAVRSGRRLRLPTLVVQSRADETVDPRSAEILAAALGGRLLWLERSRHNSLLDGERDLLHQAIFSHLA